MNSRFSTKFLLLALCVSLVACGKKEEAASGSAGGEAVVKIGAVAPLTGPQAHLGKDSENGARLAIEEANEKGLVIGGKKIKFELISEDDQADPRNATVVAQKLADQGIKGVIGHLNSGTTIPSSKIYRDAGIPQISPSATAIAYTAQGYKSVFRVITNDLQQGKALGEFAVHKMRAARIAIIDDRTAYGQGLADEFAKAARAAGGDVVAREFTTDRATDFLSILTSIKARSPELIFFAGMDAQGAPMVKQIKQLGMTTKFLGGDGIQTAEFLKLAGEDGNGVVASSPGVPLEQMPGGKAFIDKFGAKFGKIQLYAPYAYDAANALVEAMQKANSVEPQQYLPALAALDMAGVTGHITFDPNGDIRESHVTLYESRNGQWVPLETIGGK